MSKIITEFLENQNLSTGQTYKIVPNTFLEQFEKFKTERKKKLNAKLVRKTISIFKENKKKIL